MLPVGDGITLCRRIQWGTCQYCYLMLTIEMVTYKNKGDVIVVFTHFVFQWLIICVLEQNGVWLRNSSLKFL
jgi:hypothetical protein